MNLIDRPQTFIRPVGWLRASAALLVLTCATLATSQSADLAALKDGIESALQPGKSKPTIAAVVLDGLTGQTLFATANARDALIPASNMKLLTSATTLDLYGPDAVLTTTLAVSGDDLLVIGTGDPGFGDEALAARTGGTQMSVLQDWAAALRGAGIVRIQGDLVIVDTVFDDQFVHPTWSTSNRRQWYGAPVAGVNFNNNCVDFTFVPTTSDAPVDIQTLPPLRSGAFVLQGKMTSRASGGKHDPVLDKRLEPEADGRSVFLIRGGVTQVAGPFYKPVDDPRRFLGHTFRSVLADHGITVAGSLRIDHDISPAVAARSRVIATHETRLTEVLGRVNTDSQNMMAEALAKLNGWAYAKRHPADAASTKTISAATTDSQADQSERGSWAGGHAAAVAFLRRLGIDSTSVVAADGSGLSREDRVSAAVLAQLLDVMLREHPHGEEYLDSLAISGVRGSLARRLKELPGRVFAKTGTINGVSALSGYVFAENGRVAVFSILHNGNGGSALFRRQQDDAVRALAQWMNAQPAVAIDDPEVRSAMQHVGLLAPAHVD